MPLNPSPQRQSVVTFPTPNINDILFFETVDAERIGTDVPEYGTKHPDYKRWPDHRLVHIETADDQSRYYRYYYAADQIDQDDDNWAFSKADIGGTKFDAVTREYVIRRSEFDPDLPAMGAAMPDVPEGKFNGTHVLAERKQIPINDKVLNGLYVIEQRTYVKKVPLYRLDFDEFFQTENYTKQTLYYKTETPEGATDTIANLVSDDGSNDDYWKLTNGIVREAQQLSDNWYAVNEQEIVKCSERLDLQTHMTSEVATRIEGKTPAVAQDIFSSYSAVGDLQRNKNCWVHGLKGVTGIVAWNDRVGQEKLLGGIAITKRHVLYAEHASYSVNDKVYFVTEHDVLVEREIIGIKSHPNASYTYGDFGIALLNEDLPDSIDIVKVLPIDAYQYLNTDNFSSLLDTMWFSGSDEVLVFNTDQEEKAHIRKLGTLRFKHFEDPTPDAYDSAPTVNDYGIFTTTSPSATYSSWYEDVVGGDSGNSIMAIINGECVLLGVWTTVSSGGFVSAPRNYNDLNRMITDLDASVSSYESDGYQMQPIDLSFDFMSYRPTSELQNLECARLTYTSTVNYYFPPVLESIEFQAWSLRSGGVKNYPIPHYSKGAYRGPCKAEITISWSSSKLPTIPLDIPPQPEPFSMSNPFFSLDIPPTLHGEINIYFTNGTEDQTYDYNTVSYNADATVPEDWPESLVASSEVKPFRGGWLLETTRVFPPDIK